VSEDVKNEKGAAHHSNADLTIILVLTFVAFALVAIPQLSATARVVIAISTLLFAPGYALTAAIFPRRSDISDFERVALSFGLSIAVVPLLAYGLNFVWNISAQSVVVALTLFVIASTAAAYARRRALPPRDRFSVSFAAARLRTRGLWPRSSGKLQLALAILLAGSILFSASAIAYAFFAPRPGETYTEFYLLGPNGMMQGYPMNFTLGKAQLVIVGITNHEDRDVNYTVVVRLNDSQTSDTLYTGTVAVANGENAQKTIALAPNRTGNNTQIDFLLYRDNDLTAPYRETYLLVNVT
jgi:uncharacterized membrane protein